MSAEERGQEKKQRDKEKKPIFVTMLSGDYQVIQEGAQMIFFIRGIKWYFVPQMTPSESLGMSPWQAILSTHHKGFSF